MKYSSLDLHKTNNTVAPPIDFIRLKSDSNNNIYTIDDTGNIKYISSPWELSIIDDTILDPTSIGIYNEFDRYVIPTGAINDWAGHDTEIAQYNGTNWDFILPIHGWVVYNKHLNKLIAFNGTNWLSAGADTFGGLSDVSFDKTFDDWFMPSKDELEQIYQALHLTGLHTYPNTSYWCSSQSSDSGAWKKYFADGQWSPGYSKVNYYTTIPVRDFTSKISYSVGDIGPAGGFIFHNKGNYYMESSSHTILQRWCNSALSGVDIPGTDVLLGTGKQNTSLIIAIPGISESCAIDCSDYSNTLNGPFTDDIALFMGSNWTNIPLGTSGALPQLADVSFFDTHDDWYIGAIDLMLELADYIGNSYTAQGYNSEYWSSSEYNATEAQTVRLGSGVHLYHRGKATLSVYARPIRHFEDNLGNYVVGDEGPAHGTIFYKNGTTTYEVGIRDLLCNKIYWSNITNTLIGTGTTIGTGEANTLAIINQSGHTESPARWASNYIVDIPKKPSNNDIIHYDDTLGMWVLTQQNEVIWKKINNRLEPESSLVDELHIKNHTPHGTKITLENSNVNTHALIEFKNTIVDDVDNALVGIYNSNNSVGSLADKMVLISDKDIVIGSVDTVKDIEFVNGNSYATPNFIGKLNSSGLYLDSLQTQQSHPISKLNLFVDTSDGKIYASGVGTNNTLEETILTNTDITNGYIDLINSPTFINGVYINGSFQNTTFYTILTNRLTFVDTTDLLANDTLDVNYNY